MVTQTPSFFPMPTAPNMGATAGIPTVGTPATATNPFAAVLTQAQTAGNPLILALLNGLSALPTTQLPTMPNGVPSDASAGTETQTPTTLPDGTPADPNALLLAMAAQVFAPNVPVQVPAAATPQIESAPIQAASEMPMAAPTTPEIAANSTDPMTTPMPFVDLATEQQFLPTGAKDIPLIATESAPQPTTPAALPAVPAEPSATPVTTTAAEQLPVAERISLAMQAQTAPKLHAEANPLATQNATAVPMQNASVEAQQNSVPPTQGETAQTPIEPASPTTEHTRAAQTIEASISLVDAPKQETALPLNTERAMVLPAHAAPVSAPAFSADTETSSENDSEDAAEQMPSATEAKPDSKPVSALPAPTFAEAVQRPNAQRPTPNASPDRYEVAAQVTRQIETLTPSASGRNELVIQLKPEHLGQVKITLSSAENGMTAKIVTDSSQAHQAMSSAKETLREAFAQRGWNLEMLDVSLNQQSMGNPQQQMFAGMQMGNPHAQHFHTGQQTHSSAFADNDAEPELTALTAGVSSVSSGLARLDFRA